MSMVFPTIFSIPSGHFSALGVFSWFKHHYEALFGSSIDCSSSHQRSSGRGCYPKWSTQNPRPQWPGSEIGSPILWHSNRQSKSEQFKLYVHRHRFPHIRASNTCKRTKSSYIPSSLFQPFKTDPLTNTHQRMYIEPERNVLNYSVGDTTILPAIHHG